MNKRRLAVLALVAMAAAGISGGPAYGRTEQLPPGHHGCSGANGHSGRPGVVNGASGRRPQGTRGGAGTPGKRGCKGKSWTR
jgi:hypothetical protein